MPARHLQGHLRAGRPMWQEQPVPLPHPCRRAVHRGSVPGKGQWRRWAVQAVQQWTVLCLGSLPFWRVVASRGLTHLVQKQAPIATMLHRQLLRCMPVTRGSSICMLVPANSIAILEDSILCQRA